MKDFECYSDVNDFCNWNLKLRVTINNEMQWEKYVMANVFESYNQIHFYRLPISGKYLSVHSKVQSGSFIAVLR